ncbi:BQ5605_C003g02337 [Microbotryum silenes-dioicae]|uniref:BQ5605_C003g02337 protein n=1 Tax=Microbotryum silenes-dioicae TaxID=796604 RepID=A0A2X0MNJ1_9BASI|nr:BQ5605_C003g02337 [Microbotryum silenes-dioicae]
MAESHAEIPYYKLDVSHISLALLVLGAYFTTINQLSYWIKEKLFLSSALISLCLGIAFGPYGADIINPLEWVGRNAAAGRALTFQLTRVLIGIQVMFAGISLPAAYLRREALSLFVLLFPIMTIGWFVSAGFLKLFIPAITYLEALVISACITPTDPILANAIVQGRYAEKFVPRSVRNMISAESGANDGLGYPFLFIAIGLMHRSEESLGTVVSHWFVTTLLYQIMLSCAIGAVLGYIARKSLKVAHTRRLIDHESFLAYGIGLSFLTLGVVGVLGSDDVFACFIAGNSLTWQDFFRIETEDETFQDVIDSLLNASIFIYIGTIIDWSAYTPPYLTPWRMVLLALCLLAFRRLPWVVVLQKFIPAIPSHKQALFTGFFGPIGVSAIYYAILAFNEVPEERAVLRALIIPVVLFIAFSSTLVHGISIPVSKFTYVAFERTRSTMSVTFSPAATARRRTNTAPASPAASIHQVALTEAVTMPDIDSAPRRLTFQTAGTATPDSASQVGVK